MSKFWRLVFLVPFVFGLSGCGPAVPDEELGQIEYSVPSFDPVDQKFPLPQLGEAPPPPSDPSQIHQEHVHQHGSEHGHEHPHE